MLPSVNDRFKKLLTDSSGNLLTGDAFRQLTVFDFNNQKPNAGAKGGSILLATVDNFNTLIETQLRKYQGTVFPMGSLHYQQNPTCSPAVFVASLNSEDPGRSDIATSFWMLPSDIVDAALGCPETIGASAIDAWRAHPPVNLAAGVDSCLKACGLSE
jgi:hypothetical protein